MIAEDLDTLDPEQLRQALRASRAEVAFKQAVIDKLTHENAVLKRLKFAAKSEAYSAEQKSLLEETLDSDLAAVAAEIEGMQASTKAPGEKQVPKREKLPVHLPRRDIPHEPENTTCGCGTPMQRIGEDVAEKLDYQPGVFTVERHIRGEWVCKCCHQKGEGRITQAPVAPHVIDKGLPTAGLLAQVLVAKYLDHRPLYRQEAIFERAGHLIARSTLAQWVGECGVQLQPLVDALAAELLRQPVLHADETPVAMLKPGHGKTHRAYLWSYCTTQTSRVQAVVFDFAETRGGQHVRDFLRLPGSTDRPGWQGSLVTDDFSGYKALFELGVTEAGCMAHARRKFHELWANHQSTVGERALKFFGELYEVEREVAGLDSAGRQETRRRRSRQVADALHQWLRQQRQKVPDGSATARAIDYSLKRWAPDFDSPPASSAEIANQIRHLGSQVRRFV